MFGDDTDMWKRNHFRDYLESDTSTDGDNLRNGLESLFVAANTDTKQRAKDLPELLQSFPYINGGLFAEHIRIPDLNAEVRSSLLESCRFDWSQISPAVFGSMFQTVKSKDARRELGEHYTSEENILKVIEPLFLDELHAQLKKAWDSPKQLKKLKKLMSEMTFLDPACGCGNFLIVAYRELRALELEILKRLRDLSQENQHVKGQQLSVDVTYELEVSISQFYGIEIEEWPARIAETAMFLVDHLANLQLATEFGEKPERLPITTTATIKVGNALRIDWRDVCPIDDNTRIMGNPPFSGGTQMSAEAKADQLYVWGKTRGAGNLDFVSNWFKCAAEYMQGTKARAGLVSTNSVSQGVQPEIIWRVLDPMGMRIFFAHRTFAWSNSAPGEAAVHCVIIGFTADNTVAPRLWAYEKPQSPGTLSPDTTSINAYLVDGPNVLVGSRSFALQCDVQRMRKGSQPTDNGYLSKLSDAEAEAIRESDLIAARYLRPLIGAEELINGQKRWCLWLVNVSPADILNSDELRTRVAAVKQMRLESTKAMTQKDAATAWLFQEIRQPVTNYLAVPAHTSENRSYVPMVILDPETIAMNALLTIAVATTYTFGMLHSSVFNAWNKTVSGRIKSDTRISAEITYNNFPWPEPTDAQREAIDVASQVVMDARENHPDSTLADLYDPLAMPADLLKAHKTLDKAVLSAYGLPAGATDTQILAELFKRYEALTKADQLPLLGKKTPRKRAGKRD